MNATRKAIENTATSFWKIDFIQDTRMWDAGTMKPIPGTGEAVECDCCGRTIEVHAHVYQADLRTKVVLDCAVVGTQCCKKAKLTNWGQSPSNKDYWKRNYR